MAGKNSDNPWAEMSRLNLDSKEAKAPAPDSARAATVDAENAGATKAPSPAAPASAAAAASPETVSEEVVEVELSADQLQEMSIDELQELAQEAGIDTDGLSKEDLIEALSANEVALTAENQEDEEEILLEDEEEILLEDEEELESEEIDGEMSLEEALVLLGEDSETEEDFSDVEFEEVETEVVEGDASFELDDNNSNNG